MRLAGGYWCYRPPAIAPDVGPPPSAANGYITFGSLNSLAKLNPQVVRVWSRILDAVPTARLAAIAPGGPRSGAARDLFAAGGVDPARLDLLDRGPHEHFLSVCRRIDIALDPFPYAGGVTTMDALWMGLPVITLPGSTAVGRGGVSLLTTLGLTDLIAPGTDDYVRIAAALASDPSRLAALRTGLRQRMRESPLLDVARYTRDLEAAYREMWRRSCASLASAG